MNRDTGVETKSDVLRGRRIGFGICGGIGAVETVRLIRELRRHGAEITAFLTPSAEKFITGLSVEWATQTPVVRQAGADVDHLDPFDLVVVAPATLHSISKFAIGLSDNAVALLVAGHLGRGGRLAIVPTMNLQLARHPLFEEHRKKLESWGARFYLPPEEEGRWKMPPPESFAKWVMEVSGASRA